MQLCIILLLKYSNKLNNKTEPLYRAIVLCITNQNSIVRKKCISFLHKMLEGVVDAPEILKALLKNLGNYMEKAKIQVCNFI